MPEVYDPYPNGKRGRRGNAGKASRHQEDPDKPWWPGLTKDGKLDKNYVNNPPNDVAMNDAEDPMDEFTDPTINDPIFSYESDGGPPHRKPAGRPRSGSHQSDHGGSQNSQGTTETWNKLTEIPNTRGTRSGKVFKSGKTPAPDRVLPVATTATARKRPASVSVTVTAEPQGPPSVTRQERQCTDPMVLFPEGASPAADQEEIANREKPSFRRRRKRKKTPDTATEGAEDPQTKHKATAPSDGDAFM
ncbi:MAG: hypothetical protein SGARI_007487, partial [Bacillariaceae sp.]